MRFLRFPVLGAGQNDRAREKVLVREETPEKSCFRLALMPTGRTSIERCR